MQYDAMMEQVNQALCDSVLGGIVTRIASCWEASAFVIRTGFIPGSLQRAVSTNVSCDLLGVA